MFEQVLRDLGITEESVKGAIAGLLNSNEQLKETVREIVGGSESSERFTEVGTIDGQTLYAKEVQE